MSVDKVLRLSGEPRTAREEDPAGELVLAAKSTAEAVREWLLAGDVQAAYAALSALGIVLEGLQVPEVALSWTERTAGAGLLELAGGKTAAKPYGDVEYADPGYQADGKKRYPVDTEEHVRAALGYINQSDNAEKYKDGDLKKVKAAIYAAAKKFGIKTDSGSDDDVQATALALSKNGNFMNAMAGKHGKGEKAVMHNLMHMDHPPMSGKHTHGHRTTTVHAHPHYHNNDNHHFSHDHGDMLHGGHGGSVIDRDHDGL